MTSAVLKKPAVYIYHPAIDFFFICGGWLLALVVIKLALQSGMLINLLSISGSSSATFNKITVLMGTYFLSQPHTAATLFRLYGDKSQRDNHKFAAYGMPVVLVAALLLALHFPFLQRIEATLYIAFAIHHIIAQCYGIALMYCHRARMKLSIVERKLLLGLMWLTTAATVFQQLSINWHTHRFLDIEVLALPFNTAPLVVLLHLLIALTIAWIILLQIQRFRINQITIPTPAAATMLSAVALMTIWSGANDLVWIFVPAFFHASQYLAVTISTFLNAEKKKIPDHFNHFEFLACKSAELFFVGLLLFVAIPLALSALGASLALTTSLVFFAVSLHHFAADACIWKLRNPEVKNTLIH